MGGRRQYAGPVHRQTPTHTDISCIATCNETQEEKEKKERSYEQTYEDRDPHKPEIIQLSQC